MQQTKSLQGHNKIEHPHKRYHGLSYFLARISLGALFVVAGVDGFLQSMPRRILSPEGDVVLHTLWHVEPLWLFINTLQVVAGSILFFGIFDVLAIFILAPVVIGVVALHVVYDYAGIPFSLFVAFLLVALLWNVLEDPKSLLKLNFDDGIWKIWHRGKNRRKRQSGMT